MTKQQRIQFNTMRSVLLSIYQDYNADVASLVGLPIEFRRIPQIKALWADYNNIKCRARDAVRNVRPVSCGPK